MTRIVRVQKQNPDGTAQVIPVERSACFGNCHQCEGCGATWEALMFTARNPLGAKAGEVVVAVSREAPVLMAAAILYILPVALFFLGYWLGAAAWGRGSLTAGIAFFLGVGLAVVYDRMVGKRQKTVYTITEYADSSLLEF